MTNSSWKVGSWTTPTTTITQPPVPSEVSPESRSKISTNIEGQFPQFVRDSFPTFIDFVKEYYKSQELKGYCIDIIQNWSDYYNIDNYRDLVTTTTLISTLSASSNAIDVSSTRDFPSEGLLLIDDEIIYYQSKGSTIFETCSRGFNAVKAVGIEGTYKFESTTAASHAIGTEVVNLNNIFPLYMLGKFKEQFLNTFPKNFATGVTESTVIKRIKDFYASKGTGRSFQFVLRTLFGVDSQVSYPRERIFKPSDAFYTSREIIRAIPISGNPIELVGQVLYQEADPNDSNVQYARIYVKGVVEVFTSSGSVFEIDVDTNNSIGTFTIPYKTVLAQDLGSGLLDNVVTVDSTLGWPEINGKFRIEDEIISYTDKTVTQFLGCSRARDNTSNVAHDAGQEVFSAFKIYGNSNVDGSEIALKIYGGTRGVTLNSGGKYYLPDSKVTTPTAPGFDSIDPIWDTFVYNVRRALRGVSATLGQVANDGSVRCTVVTKEKHRLVRDDSVRILNAPEDLYNNSHTVVGIVDEFTFEFVFSSSPAFGISGFEFFIAKEFAFGKSDDTSVNLAIQNTTGDVQNTYKSTTNAIVASTGIPTHKIGPFGSGDLDPGNQRYLKRIPLTPSIKSQKTDTPIGQVGIGSNGVPLFSYKSENKTKYGGIKSIEKINGGSGYDITNPPTVEFESTYALDTPYGSGLRVKYNGNRYKSLNAGTSSTTAYPTHTVGIQTVGNIEWEYEGVSAEASVVITGSVTSINVTNGGSGYTTQPIVSIVGGGATSGSQAFATAQITAGTVTGITIVNGGSGYTSVPTISITGGGGIGATAVAVCRGPVNTISITNAGTQYTYEPTINLISGSGAVAYPSILNGKIESIIVTFGGSQYFGPPDVVITGDGIGATAFATVDLTTNIVTGITVSSKGIGYTAGATSVSIVYPGSGAVFQTRLTELSVNEAATGNELGSNTFVSPKTTDIYGGTSFKGENFLIYGGEYGYLYNPKQLRFLLKDSIGLDNNDVLQELPPSVHSPIIGWAYDGHPIYGPYGYIDPENASPFNQYKRIRSSYRVKSSRDALLSGLSDPLGTYIEDYEYVEGLGDLDRYNGRYCVTPEYPNGVYAYFTTITGTTGFPAFPYFVGPQFYGEADPTNWNGNGLQKNFTEDAIRYRAPFVGVDNIVAKRKTLDNKIDYFLALEDSTTLIVMETGETLTYIEDGIGYYSYYPFIRGGVADSLVVSSTNKFSSANIDQYLVEGGGKEYKVNDRLTFDNTGTGGDGVSAVVSQVEGSKIDGGSFAYGIQMYGPFGNSGKAIVRVNTYGTPHLLALGDQVTISISDNSFSRTIKTKVINGNYHFRSFDLKSIEITKAWQANTSGYTTSKQAVYVENRLYRQFGDITGTGTTGSVAPTTTQPSYDDNGNYLGVPLFNDSGTPAAQGGQGVDWAYVGTRTDGNLFQDGWSSITGGSNYADGTYFNVPFVATTGNGKDGKATIVVSGGSVASVTITSTGYGYDVGDAISADNRNLGNNTSPSAGSGFSITLTEVVREIECECKTAHQLQIGDLVNISGVDPTDYNKANYVVTNIRTAYSFTVKRNFGNPSAANVTTGNSGSPADVYVKEPNLSFIIGHSYVFDTTDTSNDGKVLSFTLDPDNTDVFTYKNILEDVRDDITKEQNSITIKIQDLPGLFYYHDINHENVSPRTYTVSVAAKTTSHPLYGYGSSNGYYITGDKYGTVTESPSLSMSRGLTYTFNQNAGSNLNHAIYFSESEDAYGGSLRYEKGVVYKINGEVVTWTEYIANFSSASSRSIEITPSIDSPDTLHYVCQNHKAMGNVITIKSDVTNSRYINVVNDPVQGTHTVTGYNSSYSRFDYDIDGGTSNPTRVMPETGGSPGINNLYDSSVSSYTTSSIYPTGGVAGITIGDAGRNYQSLPKLLGSSRSGSGATAVATISGGISGIAVTNQGQGYNANFLPNVRVTMPDFVDITLENVLGNFVKDEIIIGKGIQDNTTARGKVISWNPTTSILRLQPLRNTRTGAVEDGYIMFNSGKPYNINPSQIDDDANNRNNQFNFAAHDSLTGDPVKYVSAQTNPVGGLTVGETYYIINIGDTDFVKLAATPQLAEVGTAITVTNSGTGTQSFNIRSRVYTGGNSVATINTVTGTQASAGITIDGAGKVTSLTINNSGSNYRTAPTVLIGDPYYGSVSALTINVQSSGNYTPSTTFTGITEKSNNITTNPTGLTITVKTDSSGNIANKLDGTPDIEITDGGTAYVVQGNDKTVTFSGTTLGGTDTTHDYTLNITALSFVNQASTEAQLDASIDSITVTNAGSGYLSAPDITAQGGNGINASLNALITNQGVSTINVLNSGQQYQSAPLIIIEQKLGSGASILLKSSNLGQILKIGGENITFNYSHDRTLKPVLNTTYNLQLVRTQIIDYLDVVNGGNNFVSVPEIILVGGQGSLFNLEPIIENEVIQSVEVRNAGRGFTSAPTVQARVNHTFVALQSNSTINFPYNAKIPTGTAVTLVETSGQLPQPLDTTTTYYAIAATTANGLANNQIKLAQSLALANTETSISFTSAPIGDPNTGQTYFTLQTTDLGDNIIAYMKPAEFSIGERIYQGASTTSYTAYGFIKNWDSSGRVVSVEIVEGEFVVGEPVFGEETAAFGQIHAFDRADAEFDVSPISTSAANWEKTTGFLDLNEQRVYDSDRFQEFSYDVSSSINITDWKNPLKFAAHPAGFKVVGTQVLVQSVRKEYRPRSTENLNPSNDYSWWTPNTNSIGTTFNGTTFITPKPSAKNTGKLATINNFALSKPDYTALVPTEVSIYGKQLLDVQKILSCIAYKIDDVSDRTVTFDGSSSSIVDGTTDRITIPNHGFVAGQQVIYKSGGDRFLDARDLIINNIEYIAEETIGFLNTQYPTLTYDQAKCLRDTKLVIAAWTNDLKYGGNFFSVDAAGTYTDGTGVQHVANETTETIYAFNKARDLCLLAVTNSLPVGTYTTKTPFTDLSITTDSGGCQDVKSAITVLAGIVTNAISNPTAALPTTDIGNYPNNRYTTPIGGLSNDTRYFVRYVDANTIELSTSAGGGAIDLTSQGAGVGHSLRSFVDGLNDSFLLRCDDIDLDTKIGKTAASSQLMVSINGLIANPATYTLSNSIITFVTPPLSESKIIAMYYDRSSYTSSFVLDQIGDEIKSFGAITPGFGYSDGVFTNISLKNRLGSGVGATADITVTNGSVTNVALNSAGNGYNNTDVLALCDSSIGEQLVKPFLPTNGTYNPSTGDMVLTIGSGHGLTAATTHTPTGATYDPVTGLMVVTINNHGRKNGDQVRFADGAITFSCGYNGGGNESYPRSTDYISGRWIKVYDCTTNTFTVQVLNAWPSTNTDAHTYVTAASNSVSFAQSTVRIANESLQFSCNFGGATGSAAIKSYPRDADPIGTRGRQRDVPVEAVSTDTITVNALNGTTPTNTDAHTWVGLSSYQFTPTNAEYRHWDGRLVLTIPGNPLRKGDRIKLATDSIKMTCLQDDFGTEHTYPRPTDPAADTWLTVDLVTTDKVSVFVGETDGRYKTYQPVTGTTYYPYYRTDSNGNSDYNFATGTMTLEIGAHDLQPHDYVKIKANSLVFTCDYNGDNFQTEKTYPRTVGETRADTSQGEDDGDDEYPLGTANTWIPIIEATATTISVYVGDAGAARFSEHRFVRADADAITACAHRFVSADNNCIERAVVAYGNRTYNRGADAARLMRLNALRIATNAYSIMAIDPANSSFDMSLYKGKCIRDTMLLIDAVADNVEFGGNDATYDAAKLYVDTIHLEGEEGQSVQVFNNAKELCVGAMRNAVEISRISAQWFGNDNTNYTDYYTYPITTGSELTGGYERSKSNGDMGNTPYGTTTIQNGWQADKTISVDERVNGFLPRGEITGYTFNIPNNGTFARGAHSSSLAGNLDWVLGVDGTIRSAKGVSYSVTSTGSSGSITITNINIDTTTGAGHSFAVGDVIYCRGLTNFVTSTSGFYQTNVKTQFSDIITVTVTSVRGTSADTDGTAASVEYLDPTPGNQNYTYSGGDTDSTKPNWGYSSNSCQDIESTIRSLWGIVTQAVGTGAHTWAGGTASNAVQSGGNYAHTFVSAVANGVTSNVGNLPNPVTNVAYTPSTGNMVITSANHLLTTSNTLTIADNALSFTCTMDGNTATKTYPRSTDPVSGQTIAITNTTTNTITVNVGASPIVNHDVTDATYDNNTGVLVLTIGNHNLTAGTSVKIANNSLSFTCANDGNRSVKTYPRPSDPFYDTAINIESVVANTSITLNVGTNTGNLTGITRTASTSPEFQVNVGDVTFDGSDTTFTMKSGGSTQSLPASDNFLIFLNNTLQIKGTTNAYTYTGSTVTFTEPPLPGMDFYGYYFGKLNQLDDISPFFDNRKKTFTMRENTEPFSLESDNTAVRAENNLLIFLNGVYQEPGVAYQLTGSIIEFSEAPRAGSDCVLFIYTGSSSDILLSNTYPAIDPDDKVKIDSEGSDRLVASISSSTTIDSYEYTGLRPSVAEFSATINNLGQVTQVNITDPGSNYEVPPILIFQGGGGSGASAETTIEVGSGEVLSVTNLKGGAGYTTAPNVLVVHPLALERTQRNRQISNSLSLATTYLTQSISDTSTTINLKNVYFNSNQANGFPDEGEIQIPFWDTTQTDPDTGASLPAVWNIERILYGAKDVNANTLTVATGGRGYYGTTAASHTVLTGTYTVSQDSTIVTVTTASAHYLSNGQRIYLDFTSGTNVVQIDNNPADPSNNFITYIPPEGLYEITLIGVTTFTIQIPEALRKINPHPNETTITPHTAVYLDTSYPVTITGNVSLLPEVRLRSL